MTTMARSGGSAPAAGAMGAKPTRAKGAWADKYRRPTVEECLAHYEDKALAKLFQEARLALSGAAGSREAQAWLGVPWRWSLVYSRAGHADAGDAWAYLIPDPAGPQICVPLTAAAVSALPSKRLKKFIRDGILHSRSVAGVYWACWTVTCRTQLDEVLDLAARKARGVGVAQGEAAGAA